MEGPRRHAKKKLDLIRPSQDRPKLPRHGARSTTESTTCRGPGEYRLLQVVSHGHSQSRVGPRQIPQSYSVSQPVFSSDLFVIQTLFDVGQ
jgi:hypothetical protein